jgi:hypothetical protein
MIPTLFAIFHLFPSILLMGLETRLLGLLVVLRGWDFLSTLSTSLTMDPKDWLGMQLPATAHMFLFVLPIHTHAILFFKRSNKRLV